MKEKERENNSGTLKKGKLLKKKKKMNKIKKLVTKRMKSARKLRYLLHGGVVIEEEEGFSLSLKIK